MANVSNYSNSFLLPITEPSKFKISTAFFAPGDLALFIESLETISRLEREKHERGSKRKQKQQQPMPLTVQAQVHTQSQCSKKCKIQRSDSSAALSADEAEVVPIEQTVNTPTTNSKKSGEIDETYFSGADSGMSSPCSAFSGKHKSPTSSAEAINRPNSSDSEESGVFAVDTGTGEAKKYQQYVAAARTRTHETLKKKRRSARARFLGLLRREKAPSMHQLTTPTKHIEAEEFEMKLNNIIKQQLDRLNKPDDLKKNVQKSQRRQGFVLPADERFLDKAMRYLTL